MHDSTCPWWPKLPVTIFIRRSKTHSITFIPYSVFDRWSKLRSSDGSRHPFLTQSMQLQLAPRLPKQLKQLTKLVSWSKKQAASVLSLSLSLYNRRSDWNIWLISGQYYLSTSQDVPSSWRAGRSFVNFFTRCFSQSELYIVLTVPFISSEIKKPHQLEIEKERPKWSKRGTTSTRRTKYNNSIGAFCPRNYYWLTVLSLLGQAGEGWVSFHNLV